MYELIINIVTTLLITLIGVFGAWLTVKIGKKQELSSITAATEQVMIAAQTAVGELQQTLVEAMKSNNGGKLTDEEIAGLKKKLIAKATQQLSVPTVSLLESVQVDVNAMIVSAGEAMVAGMK